MTYRELSERLAEHDRAIPTLGLSRIEKGTRRVDADDLVALSVVLGVHPVSLLLPFTAEGEIEITGADAVDARTAWQWAEGRRPLVVPEGDDGTAEVEFQRHARPAGIRSYERGISADELARRDDFVTRQRPILREIQAKQRGGP